MKKIIVTKKYLQNWIEEQLKMFGFNYDVKSITPIQFGKYSKNNFTNKLRITIQSSEVDLLRFNIDCLYYLKEIEYHLNDGYELFWDWKSPSHFITNCEINLRKII